MSESFAGDELSSEVQNIPGIDLLNWRSCCSPMRHLFVQRVDNETSHSQNPQAAR